MYSYQIGSYKIEAERCFLLLSVQIDYPEIAEGIGPRHRFMSAYEQRIEPPDRRWQYLLLAAEPYETIAFKVNSAENNIQELILPTSETNYCASLLKSAVI